MQLEMERVMDNVSRDFDAADPSGGDCDDRSSSPSDSGTGSDLSSASAEEAALMERAKRATGCWQATTAPPDVAAGSGGDASVQLKDALALHEVRVMKSYRPRLIREGVASAKIRREFVRILSPRADERKGRGDDMKDIFWDQIILS
jgi:hypothetical protein